MELVNLKCIQCGAPLDSEGQNDFVKCLFCGFSQKKIDSERYLEKLRSEFYQFFKGLTPTYDSSTPTTVDKEARKYIFSNDIKPKISTENTISRLKTTALLANSFLYIPFFKKPFIVIGDSRKNLFERLTKLEWLAPYAVDTDHAKYHKDAVLSVEIHAHLVNVLSLILENAEVSLIINSLKTIKESTHTNRTESQPEDIRLDATLKFYESVYALINKNDIQLASMYVKESLDLLQKARQESVKPQSAFMIPSIDRDLNSVESLNYLINTASMYVESGTSLSDFILKIEKFFDVTEKHRQEKELDISSYVEIMKAMHDVMSAKTGRGNIQIASGDGDILIPMWAIPTTYTFVTGSLFMKKGKEVQDLMLICGTLASHMYTDVFLLKSGSGFMDRLSGKETTMSKGTFGGLNETIRPSSITWATKVLPFIITRAEAKKIYDAYISDVRFRTNDKIKIGMGSTAYIIYLRGTRKNDDVEIQSLKDSPIKISPNLDTLLDIAI